MDCGVDGSGFVPKTGAVRMNGESRVDSVAALDDSGSAHRWFSVGWSRVVDSAEAGRAAASAALGTVDGGQPCAGRPDPKLLIAFCAASHDPDAALAGLTAAAGPVPLVGCSTDAVITPDGPLDDGIVVVALGGNGFSVATASAPVTGGRHREAGATVASCFEEIQDSPHRIVLLLTDGFSSEQEATLAGVYSVVGASLPLIGGSASPGSGQDRTFQLHGAKVLSDAVVCAAIGSDAPIGLGLRHGWRRASDQLMVTHSANGVVKTLNDQPALETYLRELGAPAEAYLDPLVFQAFARTRPIGVSRRGGEDVRDVSSLEHFAEGWLCATGEIPEGGLVSLMEGDAGSVLDAAGAAIIAATDGLDQAAPLGLIAFDCVFRSGILGEDGTRSEVNRLAGNGAPVAGMYTWGEIARFQGINAYHNLTLAVLALG